MLPSDVRRLCFDSVVRWFVCMSTALGAGCAGCLVLKVSRGLLVKSIDRLLKGFHGSVDR